MSRNWIVVLFVLLTGVSDCPGQQYYQPRRNFHATPMVQNQYPTQEQIFARQQADANRVRQASYMQQPMPPYDAQVHQALIQAQKSMTEQKWAQMRQQANAELAERQRRDVPHFPYVEAYQAYGQQPPQGYPNQSFQQPAPQQAYPTRYAQNPSQGVRLSDANPYWVPSREVPPTAPPNPFADQPPQYSRDPFADQTPRASQDPFENQQPQQPEDPFGETPADTNPQDPAADQPAQQSQDPFDDNRPSDEIDPFADPPSDPESPEPQMREPSDPDVYEDVPQLLQESRPTPARPQDQGQPRMAPPELVSPPENQQNQIPQAPPRPVLQTPMARPVAPPYDPSRVGSPEAYVPPVEYVPPPIPNVQQPFYPPPAGSGRSNMVRQPYPQAHPAYLGQQSVMYDAGGYNPGAGSTGNCCNQFDNRCCDQFDDRCCDQFDDRCCDQFDDRCCDPPFYWSIFGGLSQINSFDEVFNPGVGQNVFDFDDGYGIGAAVGSSQGYNLRTEFDFTYRQIGLNSLVNAANMNRQPTTGNLNFYSGMWNAYWEFMRFPSERIKPYIGGGLGFVFLSPDFQAGGETVSGGTRSSFAYQGMAGVNFKFNCRTDIYAEYRHFVASEVQVDSSAVAFSNFDLDVQNFFVGFRRKF